MDLKRVINVNRKDEGYSRLYDVAESLYMHTRARNKTGIFHNQ